MSRAVRLHPEATQELESTALWYAEKAPGLGARFLDAVERAAGDLVRWPHAAPPFLLTPTEIRRVAVRGFPYRLVYLVDGDTIWVIAVAHDRRRPGFWRDRLGS